jgi:hypothetical protein
VDKNAQDQAYDVCIKFPGNDGKPMTYASSFLEMMEETNLICYEFQSQHKSFSSNITNHFKLIA